MSLPAPLQLSALEGPDDQDAAHEIASRGVEGGGGPLPHLGAIQRAFGKHDVTGVTAHVGGAAAQASRGLGARAYASGDRVAFASAPDLQLAAHEAAHVVQQRGGVRLSGGVGAAGDPYERHADAVADRVVRGESAEDLLDAYAHRGPSGGPAIQRDGEGAATRAALRAAVAGARDIYELEETRAAIGRLTESPPDGVVEVPIASTGYGVAAADLTWLLRLVEQRIAQVQSIDRDLVDRRVDPSDRPRPVEPEAEAEAEAPQAEGPQPGSREGAGTSSEEDRSPGRRGVEFRAAGQFPMQWEIPTPAGKVKFEVAVEVQTGGETEGDEGTEPVSVEGATRRSGRDPGGGVTVTGGTRALIEEALHRRLDIPGRDRIRVERRGGRWRGLVGWDFGSADMGLFNLGFRFNAVQIEAGRRPTFAAFEVPITSQWIEIDPSTRVRLRGTLSFEPAWERLVQMVRNVISRAPAAAAPEAGGAGAAEAVAGASIIEETLAAAAVAGSIGMELMGPIALVAVFAAAVFSVALVGLVLIYEYDRSRRGGRRGSRGPGPMSRETFDPRLTDLGRGFRDRVRAFCGAYTDTMRGRSPRATGQGSDAGRQAAEDWIRELETQGHSREDIHAAARSDDDLEQRVFEAARDGFVAQTDTLARDAVWDVFRVGADDPGFAQRLEWITRHLRRCVTLGEVPQAPEFEFDECRAPAGTLDPRPRPGPLYAPPEYGPVDQSACEPGGASDPEVPNPATGREE